MVPQAQIMNTRGVRSSQQVDFGSVQDRDLCPQ